MSTRHRYRGMSILRRRDDDGNATYSVGILSRQLLNIKWAEARDSPHPAYLLHSLVQWCCVHTPLHVPSQLAPLHGCSGRRLRSRPSIALALRVVSPFLVRSRNESLTGLRAVLRSTNSSKAPVDVVTFTTMTAIWWPSSVCPSSCEELCGSPSLVDQILRNSPITRLDSPRFATSSCE